MNGCASCPRRTAQTDAHGSVASASHPRARREPGRGARHRARPPRADARGDRLLGPHPLGTGRRGASSASDSLAQTITDPERIEEAIAARRTELEASFGLDQRLVRAPARRRRAGPRLRPRRGAVDPQLRRQQQRRRHHRRAAAQHDAAAHDLARDHGGHRPETRRLALVETRVTRRPPGQLRGRHHERPAGLVGGHPAHPAARLLAARPAHGRDVQRTAADRRHSSGPPRPAQARAPAHPHARARERRARRSMSSAR